MATLSYNNSSQPAATAGDSTVGSPNILLLPRFRDSKSGLVQPRSLGNNRTRIPRVIEGATQNQTWQPAPDGSEAAEVMFLGCLTETGTDRRTIVSTIKPGDTVQTQDYTYEVKVEGTNTEEVRPTVQDTDDQSSTKGQKYCINIMRPDTLVEKRRMWAGDARGIELEEFERYYNAETNIKHKTFLKPGKQHTLLDRTVISVEPIEPNQLEQSLLSGGKGQDAYISADIKVNENSFLIGYTMYDAENCRALDTTGTQVGSLN